MNIAVLITCHNRSEKTLRSLDCLHLAMSYCKDEQFAIWLNDDGCSDDTAEKVGRTFPDVRIVNGSGNDFWCGGMRRAWLAAVGSGDAYDGYLWLNDDTMIKATALKMLLKSEHLSECILVGATQSIDMTRTTYSGRDAEGRLIDPTGQEEESFLFNGNFVWVPKHAYQKLGVLPGYLTHALGDFDYGHRARKQGVKCYVLPSYVGVCDDTKQKTGWMDPNESFLRRWKSLYSPKGGPEPPVFFRYNLRNYGVLRAVRMWGQQHLRLLFPCLWRNRV